MNYCFLTTQNVQNFAAAVDALRNRNGAVPGLGLVHSPVGRGKTEALRWYAANKDAVNVEACALWTPRWMLRDIAGAFGVHGAKGTTEDLFRLVLGLLGEAKVPLIIDEADYLLRGRLLLAAVRDLHDATTVPIVLVGNEQIVRFLLTEPKVWSRISQAVEFQPLSAPEVELAVRQWTGLGLTADACELLTRQTGGDLRLVVVAVEHLERAALKNKVKEMDAGQIKAVLERHMVKQRLAQAIKKVPHGGRR